MQETQVQSLGWEDPLEEGMVTHSSILAWTLARDGVSREVPCSALKGETVPDSLPATPKSLQTEEEAGLP